MKIGFSVVHTCVAMVQVRGMERKITIVCHRREASFGADVVLVEVTCLVFPRMPGDSSLRRFMSPSSCPLFPCDVSQELLTPFVEI